MKKKKIMIFRIVNIQIMGKIVKESKKDIVLDKPRQIVVINSEKGSLLVLIPWNEFSKSDECMVCKGNITCIVEPADELKKLYINQERIEGSSNVKAGSQKELQEIKEGTFFVNNESEYKN